MSTNCWFVSLVPLRTSIATTEISVLCAHACVRTITLNYKQEEETNNENQRFDLRGNIGIESRRRRLIDQQTIFFVHRYASVSFRMFLANLEDRGKKSPCVRRRASRSRHSPCRLRKWGKRNRRIVVAFRMLYCAEITCAKYDFAALSLQTTTGQNVVSKTPHTNLSLQSINRSHRPDRSDRACLLSDAERDEKRRAGRRLTALCQPVRRRRPLNRCVSARAFVRPFGRSCVVYFDY